AAVGSPYGLAPRACVDVTIDGLPFDDGHGGSSSCGDGLACGGTYVFRTFAHSVPGALTRSEFGSDVECTTGDCAPVADAGPDQLAAHSPVTLDGSGSFDADGDSLTYVWTEGSTPIATGATPTVALGLGTHAI